MDNFSNEQYERFEAYRRNALPKQAVRRVSRHSRIIFVLWPDCYIERSYNKR